MNARVAYDPEWTEYESAPAIKLLLEQREQYIAQSAATRNGVVAPFPVNEGSTDEQDQNLRRA